MTLFFTGTIPSQLEKIFHTSGKNKNDFQRVKYFFQNVFSEISKNDPGNRQHDFLCNTSNCRSISSTH